MAQHGRYTVVRKLANGGMAEIFLASQTGHEGFQKPVVLKRILGSIYSDPQFRNMLIDEAHISMSLTHSNIVQVLDLGLADGRYFLVLELVDGWDLGQVLQRGKAAGFPVAPGLGLFIVTQVCRALAYAHAKRGPDGRPLGIVHRDVSPNNVLISEHGEVKLADFGIAKAMNKREHTGTGVVKGKVAFMSPEQGLGKPIDCRSDVFSLGTLLYVVSVGARPFDASTDLETLLRVQRADFKAPLRARADLEPGLAAVITRAMKFSPDDRYQTADDMLLDLERLLRSLYGGVGQTELKHYLAELGRLDGVPPIGRAQPVVEDDSARSGAELREGNAIVLGDEQDDLDVETTDLAEFMAAEGGGGPRLTRRAVDSGRSIHDSGGGPDLGGGGRPPRRSLERLDLTLDSSGPETGPQRGGRRPIEELSILDGAADDVPPERFRKRKSKALPTFLVLVVLSGGGYAAARYFGLVDQLMGLLEADKDGSDKHGGQAEKTKPGPSAGTSVVAPAAPSPAPVPKATHLTAPAAVPEVSPTPAPAAVPAAAPPAEEPAAGGKPESERPRQAARPERGASGKSRGAAGSRDVFKESARRVRSLSQGLDQLPPGTIQLSPPTSESPPNP